jgi:protein-L-isoaspartate O-methyltransferase
MPDKSTLYLQASVRPLLQSVAAASTTGTILRLHERALRLVPRGLYLSCIRPEKAYANEEVSLVEGGAPVEPPHIDVLILQKLRLAPGQRFLEVGCGSGYLTQLAAYLVGPQGAATGIDSSKEAVVTASRLSSALFDSGRLSGTSARPRFLHRDAGTLLELGEVWNAICVSGLIPAVWVKTLRKLLTPKGRLLACTDGKMRLFEHSGGSTSATSAVIGSYLFPPMTLSRRLKRPEPSPSPRRPGGDAARGGSVRPGSGRARGREDGVAAVEEGLALRVPGQGLLAGKVGETEEDVLMADVMREVELEEMSGLLVSASDVTVCRTPKGRKCRLGEGGFGVVYKALMNGVDEVAVKLVKVCMLFSQFIFPSKG